MKTATFLGRTWIAKAMTAVLLLFSLPPAAAAQQTPPSAPPPSQAPTPGWLGVWLRCDSCLAHPGEGVTMWEFHDLPVIVSVVDGSPARRAGLEAGDTVLRINGIALNSDEGGRQFGALREGQPVTFVVRRSGSERTVRLVPGRRPEKLEEMRKPKEYERPKAYERPDSLRLQMRAQVDSMLPRLRERLDSIHRRWRVEGMWHDSLSHDHERWMELYRDSIRIQLDSLAIRVLPIPQVAPRAPGAYRYEFRYGDTVAVPVVGWNAVAGAQMTSLGEELGEYFPGSEGGVLVLRVADGTPAARAGLKPGDVIVAVRGERVRSVEDVRKALKPYPRPVQCEVVRKGQKVNVTIQGTPERQAPGPSGPPKGSGPSVVPRSSPSG